MIEWIVKYWSFEGDTVLDPFMGAGTTGVACCNLNRKFIGIEVDEKYFNIAVERIAGSVRLI
jgi:site-specific DNA-methyltransferase (adenine-specific)